MLRYTIALITLLTYYNSISQTRYTGIAVDYQVAIDVRDVLNSFRYEGFDLGLDGTNQTVIFRAVKFKEFNGIPEKAVAIAMGKDNDNGVNIWFDLGTFPYFSKWKKMAIVLHELGHDYFNLPHNEDKESIMYYKVKERVNEKQYKKYLEELIELCK